MVLESRQSFGQCKDFGLSRKTNENSGKCADWQTTRRFEGRVNGVIIKVAGVEEEEEEKEEEVGKNS